MSEDLRQATCGSLFWPPSIGVRSPTIFAYISAMTAIKMEGRWRQGLDLLEEMDGAGLISDVFR